MPRKVSPAVQDAIDKMTNAKTVEESAIVFIQGEPGRIQDAVAKAMENGATAEQLVPLTELAQSLQDESDALTAALQPPPPGGG